MEWREGMRWSSEIKIKVHKTFQEAETYVLVRTSNPQPLFREINYLSLTWTAFEARLTFWRRNSSADENLYKSKVSRVLERGSAEDFRRKWTGIYWQDYCRRNPPRNCNLITKRYLEALWWVSSEDCESLWNWCYSSNPIWKLERNGIDVLHKVPALRKKVRYWRTQEPRYRLGYFKGFSKLESD